MAIEKQDDYSRVRVNGTGQADEAALALGKFKDRTKLELPPSVNGLVTVAANDLTALFKIVSSTQEALLALSIRVDDAETASDRRFYELINAINTLKSDIGGRLEELQSRLDAHARFHELAIQKATQQHQELLREVRLPAKVAGLESFLANLTERMPQAETPATPTPEPKTKAQLNTEKIQKGYSAYMRKQDAARQEIITKLLLKYPDVTNQTALAALAGMTPQIFNRLMQARGAK